MKVKSGLLLILSATIDGSSSLVNASGGYEHGFLRALDPAESESTGCVKTVTYNEITFGDCGEEIKTPIEVSWKDEEPPTITCPPAHEVQCAGTFSIVGTATAEDNCQPDPIPVPDVTQVTLVGCEDTETVTFTANDGCNNIASCEQQYILLRDTEPPVLICPEDVTTNCPASFDLASIPGTDNCLDIISAEPVPATVTLEKCLDTVTVIYSATDACDNEGSCTQTFTFTNDNIAPEFQNCPTETIQLGSCVRSYNFDHSSLKVTDESDCDDPVVEPTGSTTLDFTCNEEQDVTTTATDNCGNFVDCVVTLKANTPDPICEIEDSDGTIEVDPCDPNWTDSLPKPTVTDECYEDDKGDAEMTNPEVLEDVYCGMSEPVTLNWEYTRDAEGCSKTVSCGGYDILAKCDTTSDTAFGYVSGVSYGFRENNLKSSWGWGSYFPELDGEQSYDMYAGASDEKVPPGAGKYVGTITVHSDGSASDHLCGATLADKIHVDMSKPTATSTNGAYKNIDGTFCRMPKGPGQYKVDTGSSACVVGGPCCVIVHTAVEHFPACTDSMCTPE
ncbi:hypothetical protein IV203_025063 [Nitzschia inconspicua]|uniref:HYR domain-containing protein n=1 Tax=Nitzschia inconspicua TaxID=303405 RepID=A0A9K3P9V2_9STRA|nr:hypothetical protein IV203_025190 [Nitzschia inconspicua]KAG7365622.1 hypothetical protein IV203_025063 [Nitzschia inconspicua]